MNVRETRTPGCSLRLDSKVYFPLQLLSLLIMTIYVNNKIVVLICPLLLWCWNSKFLGSEREPTLAASCCYRMTFAKIKSACV